MSALSPQEFRELVRSQTDIVSLIGETILLEPRHGGREHVGLCCFHDDHNPSLRVYPDRQTFRCWSCNTGGDCFTFLMEREKVTFPEALEILARRAHLPLPERRGRPTAEQESARGQLFEALQWAENEFHKALVESPAGEAARNYLAERNVSPEMIKTFRLGFHPPDWKWILNRGQPRYALPLLREARLVGDGPRGPADFFVGRVMFPIRNERGQPVSFGGRVLPGSTDDRKYWNGPESQVFHKSRVLYGMDVARDAIRKEGTALVVEGYTACIACHQHGFPQTVATLGTALTDQHVAALKRFARKVVLVYDGDDAGQAAAQRAVERFLAQEVDLRIITLPEKLDPADFFAAHRPSDFQQLIDTAPEACDYQYRALRAQYGLETVHGRERILEGMLELLARAPGLGGIRESLLIARFAQPLSISEEAARTRLQEFRGQGSRRVRVDQAAAEATPVAVAAGRILAGRMTRDDRLECDLLELAFATPAHFSWIDSGVEGRMQNRLFQEILNESLYEIEEQGSWSLSGLIARVNDPDLRNLIVWIDEQAAAKGLTEKLKERGYDEDGCPLLLKQSLENVRWRKAEQSQEQVAVQLRQRGAGAERLDAETEALLRQAAQFHQRRATMNR